MSYITYMYICIENMILTCNFQEIWSQAKVNLNLQFPSLCSSTWGSCWCSEHAEANSSPRWVCAWPVVFWLLVEKTWQQRAWPRFIWIYSYITNKHIYIYIYAYICVYIYIYIYIYGLNRFMVNARPPAAVQGSPRRIKSLLGFLHQHTMGA